MSSSRKEFLDLAEKLLSSRCNHGLVINKGVLTCNKLGIDKLAEIRALRESVMLKCMRVRDGNYSADDLKMVSKWYNVWFSTPTFMTPTPGWKMVEADPILIGNDIPRPEVGFLFTWAEELSDEWMIDGFKELETHLSSCFDKDIKTNPEKLKQWAEAGRQVLSMGVDLQMHYMTSKGFRKQLFYENVCFPSDVLFGLVDHDFLTEFYRDITRPLDSDFGPEPQACLNGETVMFVQVEDTYLPPVIHGKTTRYKAWKDAFSALVRSRSDVCMINGYEFTILMVLDLDGIGPEFKDIDDLDPEISLGMDKKIKQVISMPLKYRVIQHNDNRIPLDAVYAYMAYRQITKSPQKKLEHRVILDDLWKRIYDSDE